MFIVGLSNLGLVRVLPCSQGTYFSTKDEQWDATFLPLTPSVSTLGIISKWWQAEVSRRITATKSSM